MIRFPWSSQRQTGAHALLLAGVASFALVPSAFGTEVEDRVTAALLTITENPTQASIARVIGTICPIGTIISDPEFQARCNEIVGASSSENAADGQAAALALQALAGEEGAAVASLQVDSSGAQIDAIGQRIANVRGGAGASVAQHNANGFQWSGGAAGDGPSPVGFFVNGLYSYSDRDTTARESGFKSDDYGVTVGADYSFSDKVLVGAAFGYKDSNADIKLNGGSLDTESYSYFGYWSLYPDQYWFIDGMVGYTDNEHEQTRNVAYSIAAGAGTTVVNNSALSTTNSDEYSASLAAGRNFFVGNWVVAPSARVEYADVGIDGFTERMSNVTANGSGVALNVDRQSFKSLTITAGGTASMEWQTAIGAVYPQLTAEYVHEFKNHNTPSTGRYVNDTSRTTIVLLTDAPDRNFFNLGAGATAVFADNMTGYVRYQALVGYKNLDVHAVEIGVRANF